MATALQHLGGQVEDVNPASDTEVLSLGRTPPAAWQGTGGNGLKGPPTAP